MAIEIKLPELGEGIETGDVLEVLVREGDVIRKEQGIVEVETDKATVEIPSSHAGKVTQVFVREGETIQIGAALISLDAETAPSGGGSAERAKTTDAAAPADGRERQEEGPTQQEPVRGGEPRAGQADALRQPAGTPPPPGPADHGSRPPADSPSQEPLEPASSDETAKPPDPVPAGPAVRRFAREVGVDLARVQGSGSGGRITREDVLAVVRRAARGAQKTSAGNTTTDDWGPVRIERLPRIRQTIAAKMSESWATAPRVTNFDDADVTELEHIRQASKEDYAAKGIKLTSMPFLIKAVAMSLRDHPLLNAALDLEQQQVIYKEYVNIGIAVDTNRGLVVPSLRGADKLAISEIARRLAAIAEAARGGSFQVADLRGSTFTISNLGAIGGTYSTPIIHVPEVAILLVGRSRKMPVVIENDQVAVRLMMPLSLSYDHRLVDGAAAARFLNDVIRFLEAPSRLLLAP